MSHSLDDPKMSGTLLSSPIVQTTLRMASPAKRPKLSIDTATTTAIFGRSKHTNSLRLETLSATSPTTRNTFGNSYQAQKSRVDTSNRVSTPVTLQAQSDEHKLSLQSTLQPPLSEAISHEISTSIGSILRNGPTWQPGHQRRSSMRSKSRSTSPAKRVVFRAPLTEDIHNIICTFAHSDVESPVVTAPACDVPMTLETGIDDGQLLESKVYVAPPKKARGRVAEEACPATPVAGRAQERQWAWTLGPIETPAVVLADTTYNALDSPSLVTVDVK